MKKTNRIALKVIGIILSLILILLFSTNIIIKNKLESYIENELPDNIEINYKGISINFLQGSFSFNDLEILIKDLEKDVLVSTFEIDDFEVNSLGYLEYYKNKKIVIQEIAFDNLKAKHYLPSKKEKKNKSKTKKQKEVIPIFIKNLNLENASVKIFEENRDSLLFSSNNININISDLLFNEKTKKQKIPLQYSSYQVVIDSVFLKVGSYNNLTVAKLQQTDKSLSITGIHLKNKYSKKEFSRILPAEKAYFDVSADSLLFHDFYQGFQNDSLVIKSSLLSIDGVFAKIYKDKLVKDNQKTKALYSKLIRELPIKLTIDSVEISNSKLVFSLKNHKTNPPGSLTISDINASVSNVSNTYSPPEKTIILVDALFMKNTPVHVNWSFDINNKNDEFTFIGDVGAISGKSLNTFITPLINTRLEGEIEHTFFTFKGNNNRSMIYMSQKYEHIKLEVLNKKKKNNKIVSGIANVFVHHKSGSKKSDYNHIIADAKREHAKSFFAYLGKNLISAMETSFFLKKNKKYKPHKDYKVLKEYHEKRLLKRERRLKNKKTVKRKSNYNTQASIKKNKVFLFNKV